MSEEVKSQEEQKGKIKKRFDETLRLFTAVLGGETLLRPTKLAPDSVQIAIQQLAAEEVAEKINLFKDGAKALIKKKIDHDKEIEKLEKEFEKKKEESMKSFVEEGDKLMRMISDIRNIEKTYYDALIAGASGEQLKSQP